MMTLSEIRSFVDRQCELWPECRRNIEALSGLRTRELTASDGSRRFLLMHNPVRIASSSAKVAKQDGSVSRPCFLCRENRPKAQLFIEHEGYEILVNPYPVFPLHLTIASISHQPQRISSNVGQMVHFAELLEGLTVFYNGPFCGASAPDHHHFQAALFDLPDHIHGSMDIIENDAVRLAATTEGILKKLPAELPEPKVNLLCRRLDNGRYRMVIVPRRKHRPDCYGDILVSPASVEVAGYIVTPREADFNSLDYALTANIMDEVTYSDNEIKSICNHQ
ncbi:MAG: DUF4922 domain-containing protein [Lachnoclostridium sp.]|nr:DUF4922 domain-containing protein [Lachnoclostridium sp.]